MRRADTDARSAKSCAMVVLTPDRTSTDLPAHTSHEMPYVRSGVRAWQRGKGSAAPGTNLSGDAAETRARRYGESSMRLFACWPAKRSTRWLEILACRP